jgi:putative ABC transport system permease protein
VVQAEKRQFEVVRVRTSQSARHPLELLADMARQTLANVRRNKLRSFLTLFGIAWGIASLVLMSALSDGFRMGQRKNMSQIGDNIVFVFGGRTKMQAGGERAGRRVYLHQRDVEAIRDQCPAVQVVTSEQKKRQVPVRSRFNAGQFLVLGVTPEYLQLRNLVLERGRHISAADVRENRRVAVLGASVRKQLFERRPNAIGQVIRINDYPYLVIGLMSEKNQNSTYDGWDNDKVVIPSTALLHDCPPSREAYAEDQVGAILYRPVSVKEWETAQHQVKRVLGRIYDFNPEDDGAVHIWDTIEGAKLFDTVFDSGEIFLAVIALVTLVLGGVGVMNTMMMAVSERTNEIGLKKAIGATRRRILLEFFMEGLLLAALSGVSGLVLVLLLAAGVNSLPMPTMFAGLPIQWSSLALATLALGTVAVVAALPPAWQAAQLTPVEALRHER